MPDELRANEVTRNQIRKAISCIVPATVGFVILTSTVLTVFSQSLEMARQMESLSRVKQISLALGYYASDHDDLLPPVMATGFAAKPFLVPHIRRGDKMPFLFFSVNPRSKAWRGTVNLAGAAFSQIPMPGQTMAFYDSQDWPNGKRCVGFVDGHAKRLTGKEVKLAEEAFKGVMSR